MEDLIIAGSLRCPSCGAAQPEDRPVCLECGMHFTAKIQILAARRPLGLPPAILGVLGVAGLLLLVVSVDLSRKPPPLVVPEGVDIFAPVVPPPPAPAPVIEPRPPASIAPFSTPAPALPPPVQPTPLTPTPPPAPPKVSDTPPVLTPPVMNTAPAEDPALVARRREEMRQLIVKEWDREQRNFQVGEYASLALTAGGAAEGQISMIGSDNVLISFASERKRVPFADLAPAARLRIDPGYRRNRIAEEVNIRLSK